jgi:hypothetical protein
VDLSVDDHRVDCEAAIVDCSVPDERDRTRLGIDLDLAGMAAEGEAREIDPLVACRHPADQSAEKTRDRSGLLALPQLPIAIAAAVRNGIGLRPSARKSRPVSTANVPGLSCAVRVSIEWIRACACGERTITGMGLVRQIQIVAIAALADQKPQIFEAPNRSFDPTASGDAVHGSLQSLRC